MTEPLLFTAAPVFTVDGEVRGELARDLLRLEVEEATEGFKTFMARFVAFGPQAGSSEERLLYLEGDALDFGQSIAVVLGPPEGARTVFTGAISALEASFEEAREPQVVVFAEDRLMDLRMTRRMRTFRDSTDAEIAEALAAEHGLTARADAPGPRYDVVQQWNQSDLAFLRERARLLAAEVWVAGEELFFQSRDRRRATELTLVRGNHLIAVELRADLAHQRTAVRVSGYDAADRAVIDEEAGAEAIQAEIAGGRTGPSILDRAFGARVSHRVREVPLRSAEAADWARAEMLRRARGFVQVSAVTRGTPDLMVGSKVRLERVGAPFDGDGYAVTRVCHTFDLEQGHRTRFEAERPTLAEASS
jgi:Bacteriophage probable baseplate hub protein